MQFTQTICIAVCFLVCLWSCTASTANAKLKHKLLFSKFAVHDTTEETILASALDTSLLEVDACPTGSCCLGSHKPSCNGQCMLKCPHVGGVCCPFVDFCCPPNHRCAARLDGTHCLKVLDVDAPIGSESSAALSSGSLSAGSPIIGGLSFDSAGSSNSGSLSSPSIGSSIGAQIPDAPASSSLAPIPSSAGVDQTLGIPNSLGLSVAGLSSVPAASIGGSQSAGSAAIGGSSAGGDNSNNQGGDHPQTINVVSHIIINTHPKKKGAPIEVSAAPA